MKLAISILTGLYAMLEYSLNGRSETLKQANSAPLMGLK